MLKLQNGLILYVAGSFLFLNSFLN